MNDLVDDVEVRGQILLDGVDVYDRRTDVIELRRRVGMVFQKSNPFPKSIYENVAYGLRIAGTRRKDVLDAAVEQSLRGAALWDEVKDRLGDSALGLSGGQQQRLVHRARHRRRARGDPDGRAVLRARSHRHRRRSRR